MHRRLKAVVADQLPPTRRERVRIELSGAAAASSRAARALAKLATARRDASTAGSNADANATGASSREARFEALRGLSAFGRATAEAKLPTWRRVWRNSWRGSETSLLRAPPRDAGRDGERAARGACRTFESTAPRRRWRASAVRRFQEDSALRVAVLSIQACGQGMTLTAARTWCSGSCTGSLRDAPGGGSGASHGTEKPSQRQVPVRRGYADDIVWPAIRRKLENLGRALDGEAATLGAEDVDEAPHRRRRRPREADGALRGELGGRASVHSPGRAAPARLLVG